MITPSNPIEIGNFYTINGELVEVASILSLSGAATGIRIIRMSIVGESSAVYQMTQWPDNTIYRIHEIKNS